jgi:hypothetical protein
MNTLTSKAKATILQECLGALNFVLNRGRALEVVAKMEGYTNYRTLRGVHAATPLKEQDSERNYHLPYGIEIYCSIGEGGHLDSKLLQEFTCEGDDEESAAASKASARAMETLLLALACAGVDLSTPEVADAIRGAVQTIANEIE